MGWLSENAIEVISLLFGTGSVGYVVVSKIADRKKYAQEVREASAVADAKGDEFWKARYDVLLAEVKSKDAWWKERYDNLYIELQNERKLSNDIVKSFRVELNEIRNDYEKQRETDKKKYDELLNQYRIYEEDSKKQEKEQLARISQLENLVHEYERKLSQTNI